MKLFSLNIFKKHPYVSIGTVLIGGILLYWFFLRSKSGPGVVASTTPVDNPQLDLAYAQLNAQQQAQGAQLSAQLAEAQLQAQTQIALATQADQVKAVEDAYTFQLGKLSQENNLSATQAQIAAETNATNKQFAIQAAQIQSQKEIEQSKLNETLEAQQNANATQLQALKTTTQGAIAQATINANLQQNLSTINAQLQNNIVQAQSQNYQAQIEGEEIINGQNASALKHGSDDSMWGSIAAAAIIAFA